MTCILGTIADKDSSWGYMITVALFSNHGVSARSGALFSGVFVHSTRLFRPFSLVLLSPRTMPVRGDFRVLHPSAGLQRLGTWCGLRFVLRVRKKTWSNLISAGSAGFSPFSLCRSRGIPSGPQSSRMSKKPRCGGTQVLAAMEGRPGQLRNSIVADEFDAFVLVNQQGVAAGLLLLRTICLTSSAILTRREKAPRWCTKHLVPAWAGWATIRVGKGPCARDGTPPSPSENA